MSDKSKTMSCPKCNGIDTCQISYGYPGDEEEYLKLVAEKKIYPGGCVTEDDSPLWYCNNCENKWGRHSDIDSFDYDQGFNLDEVYY
jgi:hypothetical protein